MKRDFVLAPEGMDLNELDRWGPLYDSKNYGTAIKGTVVKRKVLESQGDTWEVSFPGISDVVGYVPESQSGLPEGTPMSAFVGLEILVIVRNIAKNDGIVACSRKEVVDQNFTKVTKGMVPGEIIPGILKFVRGFGLYVDIGGGIIVRAVAQRKSYSAGVTLDEQYLPGDTIDLIVTEIERETKTIKAEMRSPWIEFIAERGDIIEGEVVFISVNNKVYIKVKPGIVGIADYGPFDSYKVGDRVQYQVLAYNSIENKLHMVKWDFKRANIRKKAKAKNIAWRKEIREIQKSIKVAPEVKSGEVVAGAFEGAGHNDYCEPPALFPGRDEPEAASENQGLQVEAD